VATAILEFGPGDQGTYPLPDEITSIQDGVLWGWSQGQQWWDTLMCYDCDLGAYWTSPIANCSNNNRMVLQDTGRVTVDGMDLKYWDIQYLYSPYEVDTFEYIFRHVDRLGIDPWRFATPYCQWGDVSEYYLRCYEDDEIQFHSAAYEALYGPACDLSATILQPEKTLAALPFPNPGTDHFTLNNVTPGATIQVFDAMGKCVHKQRSTGTVMRIDASGSAPGVYHIRISNNAHVQRWMKQ